MDTNSKHIRAAIIVLLVTGLACSFSSSSTPSINTTIEPTSSLIPGVSTPSMPLGKIVFSATSLSTSNTPSSSSSSRVYSMNPDGSELIQLTLDDEVVFSFAVSPINNDIAILSYSPSGFQGITILDTTGGRVNISDEGTTEFVWSSNGDQLAFVCGTNNMRDICRINSDGTESVNLTNSPDWDDSDPQWSPDGNRIAYVSQYIPPNSVVYKDSYGTQLLMMDSDGANAQLFINLPQTVYYGNINMKVNSHSPDWAPDGQHIVFISNLRGENQIYVIDALNPNTNPYINLTEQSNYRMDYLSQPFWSPDGKYILFSAYAINPGRDSIYVVSADGSTLTKVTEDSNITPPPPQWSPDGQWIGFLAYTTSGLRGLFIIRPNGNDLRLIKVFPDKDIQQFSWK